MTDCELIEQFELGTLSNENFHHREHVRVAFLYLSKYPVLEALQVFSTALRKFAAAHGRPQLYHETITWAYILLIRERMARVGKKQDWEDFARNNTDLLTWKDGLLGQYYREETLRSDLARSIFILPDKHLKG
ncbi:MAG: hypothetical protein WB755_07910 [Terriglobales bacterium]|jgi:hypothetical protein